jgi:hypothetical protein
MRATWIGAATTARISDPWLRLHERLGGRIVAPSPVSMTIDVPAGSASDLDEV